MALLITEYNEKGVHTLIESVGPEKEKKYFLEGIFMQAEKQNRNNRIYPRAVLKDAVSRFIAEQVSTGRAVGELNHPEGPQINLDKVSHRITELKWTGDDVCGKALILNTPMGMIVKGLLDGGVKLGVSSRGMGSVESRGGKTYVKEDFSLATVDIVQDPSAPSAFVEGIMEGVEFFKEGNEIVARKIAKIKKTISRTSKSQLAEAQEREFTKFMTEIANGL
jgi:hypothetical protein